MKQSTKAVLFLFTTGILFGGLHVSYSQTFGAQIDGLLAQYYNDIEKTQPAPVIESIFTTLSSSELQEQIDAESKALQKLETTTNELLSQLKDLETQTQNGMNQLRLMDIQLSLQTKKRDRLNEQIKKWETERNLLTKETNALRANLRAAQRTNTALTQKAYLKQKNWNNDPQTTMLQWVFSDQSAGQIFESQRREKALLSQTQKTQNFLTQEKQLKEKNEQKAALYVNKMNDLKTQKEKETLILTDLTERKAQYLTQVSQTSRDLKTQIQDTTDEYSQKTNELYALYQAQETKQAEEEQAAQDIPFSSDEPSQSTPDTTQEEPQNLEPTFVLPVDEPILISARFNDPEFKKQFNKNHTGIDFSVPQNSPVYAVADGTVIATKGGTYGYSYIVLQHENNLLSVYGHLSKRNVQKDELVKAGEIIARSGGTPGTIGAGSFTTGPHLHFEIYKNNILIDPETIFDLPEKTESNR